MDGSRCAIAATVEMDAPGRSAAESASGDFEVFVEREASGPSVALRVAEEPIDDGLAWVCRAVSSILA
jgi:hypothetical protein